MLLDMENCGGCRTCEIACSFHHTGEFKPSISSIKILDKKTGDGYYIFLAESDQGEVKACDGCQNLKEPMCLEPCREREELEKIIREFLGIVSQKHK